MCIWQCHNCLKATYTCLVISTGWLTVTVWGWCGRGGKGGSALPLPPPAPRLPGALEVIAPAPTGQL